MEWCQDRGPELFDLKRPDGGGAQPRVICIQETRLKTDEKLQQAYQWGLQHQFDMSCLLYTSPSPRDRSLS
eukprot:8831415-Pyramimonas_sp.AAC.1